MIVSMWCLLLAFTMNAQDMKGLDFISPFHDGYAAIQKGEKWAFIDKTGKLVVDFRNDLVVATSAKMECCSMEKDANYPIFSDDRSLVKVVKDGIVHYGYIDSEGKMTIDSGFINATHFHDGHAIVLKIHKENLGRNDVLGKNMVSYKYTEVVIDPSGSVVKHLRGPFNLLYSEKHMKNPPVIMSRFIAPGLIAVKGESGTQKILAVN